MNKNLDDKIWELISGSLNGELSSEESKRLDTWLQNENNRSLFERVRNMHMHIPHTRILNMLRKDEAWEKVNPARKKYNFRRSAFVPLLRYAAVLVVAFISGFLLNIYLDSTVQPENTCKVEVPYGQVSEVSLYDGTKVWLNSGSILEYSSEFNRKNRKVWLKGEAFFKVTHSEDAPFKVINKKGEVEVLGTSFNVDAYDEENTISVTLVEGSVQFKSQKGTVLHKLTPSEQLTLDVETEKLNVKKVNTEFYTSWTNGMIIMNNEKLSEMIKKLERWYNVDIHLASPEAADIVITGTILKNKPLDQMLKVLEKLYGFKYTFTVNSDKKSEVTIYMSNQK